MNSLERMEYAALLELVRARTGLVFPETRLDGVVDTVRAAMARAGITDFAEYRAGLARDAAFDELVDRLTVGETYFYRDPSHFRLVRDEVLREVEARKGRRALRAWSAGCSSGEEPYTLAMILVENGFAAESRILATDLSTTALEKARRGCYRPWSLRGTALAQRHLVDQGTLFCVDEGLKRVIDFRALNLAEASWPSPETGTVGLDLIFCRNVLIYLAPDAIASIARRMFDALVDGGWLILGPSDPSVEEFAPFAVEVRDEGIIYRRRDAAKDAAARPAASERARPMMPRPRAAPYPSRKLASPRKPPLPRPTPARPTPVRPTPIQSTPAPSDDEANIRALAYREGTPAAEEAARTLLRRRPMAAELHYLHALLLTDLGRIVDAVAAVRRVIYLAPETVVAHLLLGTLERRRGNFADARRALRVASSLLAAQPADAQVRLGDGQNAGDLAAMIDRELGDLGGGS